MEKYDVIIVGAGMAGMTAGIYVARAGKTVLMLESGARGGQIISALKIENWPGDMGVTGADLMDRIYHQVNNLGVKLKHEEVMGLEMIEVSKFAKGDEYSWLVKTDETEYLCGAVILAMGTKPRRLSEKQMEDAGERLISYCATCDGALYHGKPVVVVGSGNTAKHEIKYLEGICSKVYHIHHDDPIPPEAEAIFAAIGRVPNTGFLKDVVSLNGDGYVIADEECMTSCSGVFVAGDCRTKRVRQLVTAAGDGAVAAWKALEYLP